MRRQFQKGRRRHRNTRFEVELRPIPGHFHRGYRANPHTLQFGPGESCRPVRESERRVLVPGKPLSSGRLFSEASKQAGVQQARLPMGFFEPRGGGVAYPGRFFVRALFAVVRRNGRPAGSLQVIGKRVAACPIEQCLQMRVAPNARSEAVTINLPQGIDAGVASFLTDLSITIPMAIVEAGPLIVSCLLFVALSCSFLWHSGLTSNSNSPGSPSGRKSVGHKLIAARPSLENPEAWSARRSPTEIRRSSTLCSKWCQTPRGRSEN